MIPFGREFQVAQLISAVITGLSFLYMLMVSMQDRRWVYMTLAVLMLFISTVCGVLRKTVDFDAFRTAEWLFITFASILFFYATLKSNRKLEAET